MKRLLVPTDFSSEAEYALNLAIDLSKKVNAELLLMHVIEIPHASSINVMGAITYNSGHEQVYQTQLIKKTQVKLHELVSAAQKKGIKAYSKLVFGNPFQQISDIICEHDMDLVIMGSKGASGLSEIFIGSNAERVIRHAKCPVFTIKGHVNLDEIKSMAFASDLSPEQSSIIPEIKKLQKLLQLNLHIVRVKTSQNFLVESVAKKQLDEFVKRHDLQNCTASTIESEFTENGILRFAKKNNIGLIAMGTHGRSGLAHLFGGSTAEDVANHSQIPIWTMKLEAIPKTIL